MDTDARQKAIDCTASVIVQAPAGSGKTELLVQRYLSLLGQAVARPSEILAITFTKKAAQEMVARIESALLAAATDQPCAPHQTQTRELAKQVLAKNQALDWHLLEAISQIKCVTFDSFCQGLLNKQPLIVEGASLLSLSEKPEALYEEAIYMWLQNGDPDLADAKRRLLFLFDNNLWLLKNKLMTYLGEREQWLPLVMELKQNLSAGNREAVFNYLSTNVENENKVLFEKIKEALSPYTEILSELTTFSFQNRQFSEAFIRQAYETAEGLESVADLLLTKEDEWRKTVDARVGFPAKNKNHPEYESMKQNMKWLLDKMAQDSKLKQALVAFRYRPHLDLTAFSIEDLSCLIEALLSLFQILQAVFFKRGEADFSDFALKALLSLGGEEAPSDTLIRFATDVKHILVDEFQDTSASQWDLLERIVGQWMPGEGHTLFLVGDPMQSIYRFRNAKVEFFLKAREEGIAGLTLTPLFLSQNFRSNGALIAWSNARFSEAFGAKDDLASGVIGFTPAVAHHPAKEPAVFKQDEKDEATLASNWMVNEIISILNQDPKGSIAVLVKNRHQLPPVLEALSAANLMYEGISLFRLSEQPWVLDWFMWLTLLCDPLDRLAWCALLRSPLIGCDDEALIHFFNDEQPDVYTVIKNVAKSFEKTETLLNVLAVYDSARRELLTQPVSVVMEKSWHAIGGETLLPHEAAWTDIEQCMGALERKEEMRGLALLRQMKLFIENMRSNAVMGTSRIQIMTIHQAKGLEFDYVFLVEAEKILNTGRVERGLLFESILHERGESHFLISFATPKREPDRLYRYLEWRSKLKNQEEAKRLFYVAVTRAKQALYLACK